MSANAEVIDVSAHDHALPNSCERLYVGVSGDVKVEMHGAGGAVVFKAVPVGILEVRAKKIIKVGTTAGSIIALW